MRITDSAALDSVMAAVGALRLKLEGLFSMGLANSPMHNASIRLISGNFVVAKPVGVRGGFDYQHTGEVRRIDVDAIRQQLGNGNVVLLSPVGGSPTGELFNVNAEEVASTAAIALGADKLIIMGETCAWPTRKATWSANSAPSKPANCWPATSTKTTASTGNSPPPATPPAMAWPGPPARCPGGRRTDQRTVHPRRLRHPGDPGNLRNLRGARIEDVGGILELIEPLEEDGTLVRRSRELLENEIQRFAIIERDGMVIACAALYPFPEDKTGELACVAVHSSYRKGERGAQVLAYLERRAREQGCTACSCSPRSPRTGFSNRGLKRRASMHCREPGSRCITGSGIRRCL